ncbi:MAG TPA: SNF2-related protein, partial [Candidatus Obscuribacterales bacterium]
KGEGRVVELLAQLQGKRQISPVAPHSNFRGRLRPYQERGLSWLSFLSSCGLGACLADDMGLGKTVQTLAFIQKLWYERKKAERRPTLLVCPMSVLGNWQAEIARFTPDLPCLIHHGTGRLRGEELIEAARRYAVTVTSYALLNKDREDLKEVNWLAVILDEAQNIKNPEAKQARAAFEMPADVRVALTGTPVENSVGDLWSIMNFLNPGFLGSQLDFKQRFYWPIQMRQDGGSAEELRRLTAPLILRRQEKSVQVHKFICSGTLEEKIDELIERKELVASQTITAGEGWLTELSTAELRDLFALREHAFM